MQPKTKIKVFYINSLNVLPKQQIREFHRIVCRNEILHLSKNDFGQLVVDGFPFQHITTVETNLFGKLFPDSGFIPGGRARSFHLLIKPA
jgi:hypothetical protein